MNIVDLIRAAAKNDPEHPAIVEAAHRLTYGHLLAAVDRMAITLRAEGIAAGHRVAFVCDDSADYIVVSLAILACGAALVPVSTVHKPAEIECVLASMAVHYLLFDSALPLPPGERKLATEDPLQRVFALRTFAPAPAPPQWESMDAAFVRFSSGTTGASKGVVLSHRTIEERTSAANRGLNIDQDDVVLWVLSMSYHFVVSILLFLRQGATIVLCAKNMVDSIRSAALEHGGTFIYASPFHYHLLAHAGAVQPEDLQSIRMAISTAVRLPREIGDTFHAKFGFEISEAYGIIEIGLPFINAAPSLQPGSVGQALPDFAVRIESPDEQGVGEIFIRGKGLFDAYFVPWRSRDEVAPDGWFATGDLGRMDATGFLSIVDRVKNVINFAGMKIFPAEVEEVLNAHPSVREALVYGKPHSLYGQLPCAKIVSDAAPNLQALRRHCFQHLAAYKVPKEFEVVDQLERTASDKLKR